jgi:hypothetical protein
MHDWLIWGGSLSELPVGSASVQGQKQEIERLQRGVDSLRDKLRQQRIAADDLKSDNLRLAQQRHQDAADAELRIAKAHSAELHAKNDAELLRKKSAAIEVENAELRLSCSRLASQHAAGQREGTSVTRLQASLKGQAEELKLLDFSLRTIMDDYNARIDGLLEASKTQQKGLVEAVATTKQSLEDLQKRIQVRKIL